MEEDDRHLQLLTVFHYVVGAITALMSCIPIIHLVFGILILTGSMGHGHNAPPRAIGALIIGLVSVIILMGWTFAACIVAAGRRLSRRKNWTFCLVVAAFECMMMPFGTVLGVFTIVVLMRPSVKEQFETLDAPATPASE